MSVAGEVEDVPAIAALKDSIPHDGAPNGHATDPNYIIDKKLDTTKTVQDSLDDAATAYATPDVTADDKEVDAPTETLDTKDSADTLVDVVVSSLCFRYLLLYELARIDVVTLRSRALS